VSAVAEVAGRRLAALRRYRPGERATAPGGKLSSNESALGPAPAVRQAAAAAGLNLYPASEPLREALAAALAVATGQLVLTSGSDELCYLIATLFIAPGRRVVLSRPCYQIDELVTRVHDGDPVFVDLLPDGHHDLEAMAEAAQDASVLWLPSPHNPSGAAAGADGIARLLEGVPQDCLVVLDEAYGDYADRRPDVRALLAAHPNLLVQRTFSKAYALAGLRIGYGLASPELIAALDAIRPPFNVNAVAIDAAIAALEHPAWRDYGIELVVRERTRLQAHLDALGFERFDSQANFVTARVPHPDRLHERLAARGIAVRDGADLGLEGWTRISIGAPATMALVRAALTEHKEQL
jgi:histidinol-phosphate aminotransferase